MVSDTDWINERFTIIARSQSELRERVDCLTEKVDEHERILSGFAKTQADVAQMVSMFNTMRGGVVVLGWIGTLAKWLWPVIALGIAISVYLKSGEWRYK
jgi:hypothetical protein